MENKMSTERKGKLENFDPQVASSNSYNDPAGAQKNLAVGAKLLPILTAPNTWTTDATTALSVPKGSQLAVYNNSSTLYGLRCSSLNTVTAGAAGTVDANGNVSIACTPNAWTYISVAKDNWIITQNSALIVYLVDDHTTYR